MYFVIPGVHRNHLRGIALPITMTGTTLRTDHIHAQTESAGRALPRRSWRSWRYGVASMLLLGALVRLPFAAVDLRPSGDMQTYERWARTIQAGGLSSAYDGEQAAYPPLLLYVFGAAAFAGEHLHLP